MIWRGRSTASSTWFILTTDPAKTLHAIYSFLGEPTFEHDFDHIDYDVTEFEERAGTRDCTPWPPL